MTPYGFARAECANMLPDGLSCRMIEPTSLHDYRVSLPPWLSEAQWRKLVSEARERGEKAVSVNLDTSKWLDRSVPHYNRRRLDLYFCPDCGCRMGVIDTFCLDCVAKTPMPGRSKREHSPPHCRQCGELVKNCGPDADSVLCSRCTMEAAGLLRPGRGEIRPKDINRRCRAARRERCIYFEQGVLPLANHPSPKDEPDLRASRMEARSLYLDGIKRADAGGSVRECPECGAPLAKRQRRCSKCQASLRREVKRTWAQKERATVDS